MKCAAQGIGNMRGFQTALVSAQTFMSANNHMANGFDSVVFEVDLPAERMTDDALALMEAFDPDEPWHLFAHYVDPHMPYDPPPEYLGELDELEPIDYDLSRQNDHNHMLNQYPSLDEETQALIREHIMIRYLAEYRYADDEVGRLLAEAESMGLLDDTLVMFASDHGEQLFEHGENGHGEHMYDDENLAIVAFSAPGLAPGVFEGPTSHADVWPSVFQAMGWEEPEEFNGTPIGQRPDDTVRYALRYQGNHTFQAIEREDVKMIYWWRDGEKDLYRLDEDPEEMNDVYDPEDPDVIALWDLLLVEIDGVQAINSSGTPTDPGP